MNRNTLRVIDMTDQLGWYGARLMVGMGAEVIRIDQASAQETKAQTLHWHAGKRRWLVERPVEAIESLLSDADVVLESGPVRDLVTVQMRGARADLWEHVVHVVLTPFGLTGPLREWLGDDTVLAAAGGMAWLGGDPGRAPEPPPREQALHLAGAHAAMGAMLAVIERQRSGVGQLVDVSAQEAVAATLETGAISYIHGAPLPARTSGIYGHVAHRVFTAADGHVAGGYSGSNRMWDDLLEWMLEEGEEEDLADEAWSDPVVRWQNRPHVDAAVARFAARRSAKALAEEARRRALPWAEVVPPSKLPDNPQLRARQFFTEIDGPHGPISDLGFPYESPAAPRPVHLHCEEAVSAPPRWSTKRLPGSADTAPSVPRPLNGLRVLDLTWVLAGPYATKTLGDFGADIVKVESRHRQDPTRYSPGMRLRPGASPDESGYFLNFNRNKRSLALNLRHPDGPALLRSLVPKVDVVVENYSPGVLAKWGMSFGELKDMNPSIVLVSMAGVGQDGPWKNAVTFADTLAAMSGLTFETGREDRPPQGLTFGLGDMVAANAAVLATLDLLHAGGGGHVDLSQLEAMSAQLGLALLEDNLEASTSVFRTAGDDRWLAVGTTDYERIANALKGWLPDVTPEGLTSSLTAASAETAAEVLQDGGVAAYPVRDGRDLVSIDRQLSARGFYIPFEHPLAGKVLHEGVVPKLSRTPGGLQRAAPLLGQHTDELLAELLDMSRDSLGDLHREGVLE